MKARSFGPSQLKDNRPRPWCSPLAAGPVFFAMLDNYILIGQTPVPEPDLLKWAEWMATADRVVFQTEVGASLVSTVFLALDHQFGIGPPLLFETMIFTDGDGGGYMGRCSTWLEAEQQHAEVVTRWSQHVGSRAR